MVNREHRHGRIKVLFACMETQIHSLEVNLELCGILLLLSDLLLLFVSQPSLLFFEPLLCKSGLLLSLLVLFLLIGVGFSKLLHRNWLWLFHDLQEFLFVVGEFFELALELIFGFASTSSLNFNIELSVRILKLLCELPNLGLEILSSL